MPAELSLLLECIVSVESGVPAKEFIVVYTTEVAHASRKNYEKVFTLGHFKVRSISRGPVGHVAVEIDYQRRLHIRIIASWHLDGVLALCKARDIFNKHLFLDQTFIWQGIRCRNQFKSLCFVER